MEQVILGKIEIVKPRDIWTNEERDFTPWLAQNIDEISKTIGISIVIEQTEKRVGSFELDIYGKVEGTNKVVIIENQLEQSDHKHLGQLITYAAGLEAAIIIWITPQINDAHRAAIDWLNRITNSDFNFFLIRPEVIRINDSLPAARFQIEAGPSDFIKIIKETVDDADAPRHEFRMWFWGELYKYLSENGHPWAQGRRSTKDGWITSSVGKSGLNVNVSMARNSRIRVEIYMDHNQTEQNKTWYDELWNHKTEVESLFNNQELGWEPLENAKVSRVAVYLPYEKEKVESDEKYRERIFEWIGVNLKIFREVAKRYICDKS